MGYKFVIITIKFDIIYKYKIYLNYNNKIQIKYK